MHARTILVVGVVATALSATTAKGQGYWTKKPWQQWSSNDCRNMLQNSPWAQTWSNTGMVETPMGQPSDGTGREQVPEIYYLVQLRSALPVREAVARQAQIQDKYDRMDASHKKAFDDSVKGFLTRNYDDDIVVHLDYGSNVTLYERDMMQYWQSFPPGVVPMQTYLIGPNGQKLVPARMEVAPGGQTAVEFIFARKVNGASFIKSGDKSFAFQFMSPAIGTLVAQRAYIEFKPSKMLINGQLAY